MLNFPLILLSACLVGTAIWVIYTLFLSSRNDFVIENVRSLLPVLWVVLILRSFIVEPFQIPSGSMIPTLKVGDFILVNKFTYGLRLPVWRTKVLDISDPQRGDVMVFFPPNESRYFIKRIVGIPGDRIQYVNKKLIVNGQAIEYSNSLKLNQEIVSTENLNGVKHQVRVESHDVVRFHLKDGMKLEQGIVVKPGHYFMMGDNRDRSEDSREWGQVHESRIVGKAFFVWLHWPQDSGLPSFKFMRSID
jgi:signal peptidase I